MVYSKTRVVLIGNQRFGDGGPMDAMARGLDKCKNDFGFQTKKLESPTPAEHEESVRAMAREGYDLIMTTFPPMTDATVTIANEYPNISFAAIYQFVNVGGKKVSNVWDTEYQGQQATYLLGRIAAQISDSKRLGYVQGDSSEPIVNERNGFILGAKSVCSNCKIEFAVSDSWEDPVKGKEIALAMYSRGADIIETAAALTQMGVIEAAKETNKLVIGDVGDNYAMHPKGFVGFLGVDFGANVYLGCKMFKNKTFPKGKHTNMDITNGGYYVPWDVLERFAKNNIKYEKSLNQAIKDGRILENEIINGDLVIEYNSNQKPPK